MTRPFQAARFHVPPFGWRSESDNPKWKGSHDQKVENFRVYCGMSVVSDTATESRCCPRTVSIALAPSRNWNGTKSGCGMPESDLTIAIRVGRFRSELKIQGTRIKQRGSGVGRKGRGGGARNKQPLGDLCIKSKFSSELSRKSQGMKIFI